MKRRFRTAFPPLVTSAIGAGVYPLGAGSSVGALRAFAPVLLVLACDLLLQALSAFRRAGTTVDPIRIQHAFALMTGRFDDFTRKAMCLGMILLLAAWALWLGGAVVWVGPVALAICLDRFQTGPEERAMAARFGAEYDAYSARV